MAFTYVQMPKSLVVKAALKYDTTLSMFVWVMLQGFT